MTDEKVIELANQAGITFITKSGVAGATEEWLVNFAQLVQNEVIEECARDVEDWGVEVERDNVAASIRSLKS